MLPEILQVTIFVLVFSLPTLLLYLGLKNLVTTIIVLEVLFILILIQKNIIYRRISKIENAIKHQIIWIKTKKGGEKVIRYLALGTIFTLTSLLIYWYFRNNRLLLIIVLPSILFILKSIFYVPTVFVRIIDEGSLQLVDESRGENVILDKYELKRLEILQKKVRINTHAGSTDFELLFDKLEERNRLKQFLNKVLKKVKIE